MSNYSLASLDELSKAQISRLLNGHGVRVKHGTHNKVHLSKEQHKKLSRAHLKGSAITLRLDPFQMQHHQYLRDHLMRGGDFWSDAGAALKPGTKETLKFVAANAPELARFAVTAAGHPEYGDMAALGAEATVP